MTFWVVGTAIGGTLGYLAMLDTHLATNPYGLMVIICVYTFLVGCTSAHALRAGIVLTLMTLSSVILCQVGVGATIVGVGAIIVGVGAISCARRGLGAGSVGPHDGGAGGRRGGARWRAVGRGCGAVRRGGEAVWVVGRWAGGLPHSLCPRPSAWWGRHVYVATIISCSAV